MKTEMVTSKVDRDYVSQEAMGAIQPANNMSNGDYSRLGALMNPKWYRIDRFLEKIGKEFVPNQHLTVVDLVHMDNLALTRAILEKAVRSTVQINHDASVFSWTPDYVYASKTLCYQVEITAPVYYHYSGRLVDPFNWFACRSSFIEAHYGFSMNTDRNIDLAPVNFEPISMEGTEYRYSVKPCSAEDADGYLVRVAWGGSTSKMLGMLPEKAGAIESIVYLEHVTSKKGGEGRDFYILRKNFSGAFVGADKVFLDEVRALETKWKTFYADIAQHFADRLKLVRQLEDNSTVLNTAFNEYNAQIEALLLPCWQHPVAKLPFVKVPTISEPQFPELPEDLFLCSLEEIYNAINHFDSERILEYNLTEAKRITSRWLDFAPAYALMIDDVQTLSGTMVIDGEQAIIKVPNCYAPGEIDTIVGLFEATQFSVVKSKLKDRISASEKAFRAVLKAKKEFEASNY